jgi:dihydropteroate synthase
MEYTLNVKGSLMDLSVPQVMGIVNATPDSFFAGCRVQTEEETALRCRQIAEEGGTIVDVGACSTRPGSEPVAQADEMQRLRMALAVVRRTLPDAVLSVDTFRPDVARMAVEEFGADIINDVSGGSADMFRLVAKMGVPYVLTSQQPDLRSMLLTFAAAVQQLRDFGQKDIILDPGFGFGKTLDENYRLMAEMEKLQVFELPILVGISRKSMIYKLLETSPAEALNGTTFLNTIALMKGASILRVHDVKEAVEIVKMYDRIRN